MAGRSAPLGGRLSWTQVAVSFLVVALGFCGAMVLGRVDQDLRIIYTQYTLAAADLAHISADVMRYRTTVIRGLEAPTEEAFARLTAPLPAQRARIESAVDQYAKTSLRVSRSGRSEQDDLLALQRSLEAYFAAADEAIRLMRQVWAAGSVREAGELRHRAELHAADNAGPKLIQESLALDRLMETVADVAKDMKDEGASTIRFTGMILLGGSLVLAILNLWGGGSVETSAVSGEPAGLSAAAGLEGKRQGN
jgi:hypothetical protein